MSHPIKNQRRLQSVTGSRFTRKTYPTQEWSNSSKPLPMFAKEFTPGKGMMPASVFIGSFEAIAATKAARDTGTRSRVCIKPGDNPSQFSWGFLHSLPVLIYAEDDLPLETVHTLIIELARCGASHITAMRLTGKVIAYYSPDAGRAAA